MKISSKLKDWLLKNNFEVKVKKDSEFSYYYGDECIHWCNNGTIHDKYYLKFISKLGYNKNLDIRTISFLHELGHHELSYDYNWFDYLVDLFRGCIEGNISSELSLKIRSNLYYRLPIEYKATKWMVEFTNMFEDECNELNKIFIGNV